IADTGCRLETGDVPQSCNDPQSWPFERIAKTAASQIATLENASGDNAWFVTHHPFWGIGEDSGELFMINDTLQAASKNVLTGGINVVLSAHIHLFEMLNFVGDRQPQFVIGISGTELDPPVTDPLEGVEIGGATVSDAVVLNNQFGFVLMELVGEVWQMSIRDVEGCNS
ncbi:MAG: hypothetical protein KAJ31_06285, partial [Deltaproteobacteria bacterium]|nr:hypothetical protein [Deltaproteobacteria bacterium]